MTTTGTTADDVRVDDDAPDWDWPALIRRARMARRAALLATATTVVSVVGALTLAAAIPSGGGRIVSLLGVVAVVSGVVTLFAAAAAENLFLLEPHRYFEWLRVLPPYEPETFWGQFVAKSFSSLGACFVVVLGGIIGVALAAERDPSRMLDQAWAWVGVLVGIGFPFVWWTTFLVQLASSHRRAIVGGQLPAHPDGRKALFWLFFVLWWVGFVVFFAVVAAGPYLWRSMVGTALP